MKKAAVPKKGRKFEYTANLRQQSAYGLLGFLSSLLIIYLVTQQLNWTVAIVIGIGNFFVAGFYSNCCK